MASTSSDYRVMISQFVAGIHDGVEHLDEARAEGRRLATAFLGVAWNSIRKSGDADKFVLSEKEEVMRVAAKSLGYKVGISKLKSELVSRDRRDLAWSVAKLNDIRKLPAHPGCLAEQISSALSVGPSCHRDLQADRNTDTLHPVAPTDANEAVLSEDRQRRTRRTRPTEDDSYKEAEQREMQPHAKHVNLDMEEPFDAKEFVSSWPHRAMIKARENIMDIGREGRKIACGEVVHFCSFRSDGRALVQEFNGGANNDNYVYLIEAQKLASFEFCQDQG